MQEYNPNNQSYINKIKLLVSRLSDKLQIVITVINKRNRDLRGNLLYYIGALVELFKLKNKGRHNNRHSMIEV